MKIRKVKKKKKLSAKAHKIIALCDDALASVESAEDALIEVARLSPDNDSWVDNTLRMPLKALKHRIGKILKETSN